jgi:hypothetical protein
MERVLGIGGIFLKARDPKALATWPSAELPYPNGSRVAGELLYPGSARACHSHRGFTGKNMGRACVRNSCRGRHTLSRDAGSAGA